MINTQDNVFGNLFHWRRQIILKSLGQKEMAELVF